MTALKIRTAVGDIAPREARRALTHEHFVLAQHCDRSSAAVFIRRAMPRLDREIDALAAAGCNLMADVTPVGYPRPGDLYRRISERSGIRVVASTGTYVGRATPAWFARLRVARMTEVMVREIEEGIEGEGVRAGIVEAASANRELAGLELRTFRAAVEAHRRTGAPITCHSYPGLSSQVAFFKAQKIDLARVAVGHVEANAWMDILNAARSGLTLCVTNLGSERIVPDGVILAQVAALVRRGHERQILMSTDFHYRVIKGRVRPGWPRNRYDHIFRRLIPQMRALGMSARTITRILDENPRRFLAF